MYERISSKGLTDPTLEPLLSAIADPFSAYGPPRSEDQIYSILGGQQSLVGTPGIEGLAAAQGHFDDQGHISDPSGGAATSSSAGRLIMSPSTPSKGLSRSGAVSPPSEGSAAVVGPNNGLGISLAAAATLARASIGGGGGAGSGAGEASTTVSAVAGSGTTTTKPPNENSDDLDLFGKEGDEEEEGSIFSGAEEDEENNEGVLSPSQSKLKAAKRRERAMRTSAARRLKHALSIIDEGKTNRQEPGDAVQEAETKAGDGPALAKAAPLTEDANDADAEAEQEQDTSGDERRKVGQGGDRPAEGAAPAPAATADGVARG